MICRKHLPDVARTFPEHCSHILLQQCVLNTLLVHVVTLPGNVLTRFGERSVVVVRDVGHKIFVKVRRSFQGYFI